MFKKDGYRPEPTTKPTDRRKNRPKWAVDEQSLLARVKTIRQWHIARMYWLENRTARNISKKLKTTVKAIESVLYRLTRVREGISSDTEELG